MKKRVSKMRKGAYKAKSRREWLLLFKNVEAVYLQELSKSFEDRDEALLYEALETMECASSALLQKRRVNFGLSAKSLASHAGIALAALAIFVALSTGVASAFGIDVLSIVFRSNGSSISVDIRPTDLPDPASTPSFFSDDFVEFESTDAACKSLCFTPTLVKTQLPIVSVSAFSGDMSRILLLSYGDGESYLTFTAQDFYIADTVHDVLLSSGCSEYTRQLIGENTYYFIGNSGDTIVLWNVGSILYRLDTNISEEAITLLLP